MDEDEWGIVRAALVAVAGNDDATAKTELLKLTDEKLFDLQRILLLTTGHARQTIMDRVR
jgi:hypothetical protein